MQSHSHHAQPTTLHVLAKNTFYLALHTFPLILQCGQQYTFPQQFKNTCLRANHCWMYCTINTMCLMRSLQVCGYGLTGTDPILSKIKDSSRNVFILQAVFCASLVCQTGGTNACCRDLPRMQFVRFNKKPDCRRLSRYDAVRQTGPAASSQTWDKLV